MQKIMMSCPPTSSREKQQIERQTRMPCEPSKSRWSPLLMDTRKPRDVTSALSASWLKMRYLLEGRAE
ncbi:hypothetical protein EVAR_29290_1 [Eumeta japonica]|uniref:Uncharacterized protein n=1 Tax=Eumeta variegata TaxID=151549 RepID=A0A4C1VXC9_EUMVA|nr:hypothetical protein EVAR_29290_1 [Eumeta japonica]